MKPVQKINHPSSCRSLTWHTKGMAALLSRQIVEPNKKINYHVRDLQLGGWFIFWISSPVCRVLIVAYCVIIAAYVLPRSTLCRAYTQTQKRIYQSYCVLHAEMIAVLQNALRLIVFEKIENQKSSSTRTFSEISRKRKHAQFSFKTRKIEEITRNFLVRFLIFLKKVGCPGHGRLLQDYWPNS